MTQKELIKKLQSLSAVEPNEEFARVSRSVILSSKAGPIAETAGRESIFSRSISFALSVTLAAAFLVVLILGNIAGPLKTLFLPTLPGVGGDALIAEADTITQDINIRLDEIQYFQEARQSVALAGGTAPPDEGSEADALLDGEDDIDKLLEEVIQY